MYTQEQLTKYPYFAKILEKNSLDIVLDTLTGIVSRGFILGFVRSLIADGTPFLFAFLDLDNFKFINDTYGHHVGDGVLAGIGSGLINYLDGYGIAGRFGGDEILVVNLRDIELEDKRQFLNGFYYGKESVLRRNIHLETYSPFITGTIGCAVFPNDAKDYDTLFELADKTLYRGKTKGRNCYVFYREDMHKNLQIKENVKHGLYETMHSLAKRFENGNSLMESVRAAKDVLFDELRISELYYTGKKGYMHALVDQQFEEIINDIDALMTKDLYSSNTIAEIDAVSPVLYEALMRMKVETLVIVRIADEKEKDRQTYGYLICAQQRSLRIWQEDECALLYFLAKLMVSRMRLTGEQIPEEICV